MARRSDGRVERPILVSAEMVRAIVDGRKTDTRSPLKGAPAFHPDDRPAYTVFSTNRKDNGTWHISRLCDDGDRWTDRGRESVVWRGRCPFGESGDLLWVRETWAQVGDCGVCPPPRDRLVYRADYPRCVSSLIDRPLPSVGDVRWTPSIHMPRWASRILLRVEEVRVERDEQGRWWWVARFSVVEVKP